jgi:rare lipoprotein A
MIRTLLAAALCCALASTARAETCTASQYGVADGYHGRRTASGSIFNTFATNPYTVAHLTRSLGSWVTVTNLANGRSIRAKVTDRGPYYHARCVDLGRAGADAIGMGGTARVRVEATTSIAP